MTNERNDPAAGPPGAASEPRTPDPHAHDAESTDLESTGTPTGDRTNDASGDPFAELANDPRRWRELAAAGRFEQAERMRILAVGEGAEPDSDVDATGLRSLADAQAEMRRKLWSRSLRRLQEVEGRPDWIDWDATVEAAERLTDAGAMLDRREVAEAKERLDEGPAGPLEAERLTQLGTVHVLDQEPEEARACFDEAIALDPKHPRAIVNLGNVALEAGEVDRAIELYQAAIELDDGFANAHHNLGVAYRKKGRIGDSVKALRRAQKAERARDSQVAREELRGVGKKARRGGGRWVMWAIAFGAVIWFLASRGGP